MTPPPSGTSSATSAERRSPAAALHDPPVVKVEWTVEADSALDDFLADARRRGGWDDSTWERMLRHGGMHLDRVRFEPERPPATIAAGTHVLAYALTREPLPVAVGPERILLDHDGVVACDKPPWLTTQGSRGSRESSLERAVRRLLGDPAITPAHRLDRETSGVVLFTRNRRAASAIGRQLERRTLHKEYLAVVSPPPPRDRWEVSGWMVRIAHPSHSLFALRPDREPGARHSHSSFEVVERRGERCLVRALPATGRTHQLRIHLAASGCPIVGDSLYGLGFSEGEPWSAQRLQLHAASVGFHVADDGPPVSVVAPPPADFGLDAP